MTLRNHYALGALACLILCFFQVATAAEAIYPFQQPPQKALFTELITEFRCLVCQNQNLADSNAPLAQDLRQDIYTMVKAGKSKAAITDFLVNRYGQFVLYRPPVTPNTYLLWFGPGVLLLLGLGTLLVFIQKRNREQSQ